MRRRQFTHAGIGCLVCIGGILSLASPAAAGDGPASAVSQYVETIPTSGGSQAVGSGRASKSELSPSAKAALGAVDPVVAKQLTVIATSSSYGAPATPRDKGSSDTGSVAPQPTLTEASSVSTLGIVDANASLVIALSTILGITTVTMILVAALGKGRGQA